MKIDKWCPWCLSQLVINPKNELIFCDALEDICGYEVCKGGKDPLNKDELNTILEERNQLRLDDVEKRVMKDIVDLLEHGRVDPIKVAISNFIKKDQR